MFLIFFEWMEMVKQAFLCKDFGVIQLKQPFEVCDHQLEFRKIMYFMSATEKSLHP